MNQLGKPLELPQDHNIKPEKLIALELMLLKLEENMTRAMDRENTEEKHSKWFPNFKSMVGIVSGYIFQLQRAGLLDKDTADELNKETLKITQPYPIDADISEEEQAKLISDLRNLGLEISSAVMKKIEENSNK